GVRAAAALLAECRLSKCECFHNRSFSPEALILSVLAKDLGSSSRACVPSRLDPSQNTAAPKMFGRVRRNVMLSVLAKHLHKELASIPHGDPSRSTAQGDS